MTLLVRSPAPRRVLYFWGALLALTAPPGGVLAAPGDEAKSPPQPGARCEVAVVSSVSGYAECVKPRGAALEPPPPRPAPTPDECARHAELDVEACKGPKIPTGH